MQGQEQEQQPQKITTKGTGIQRAQKKNQFFVSSGFFFSFLLSGFYLCAAPYRSSFHFIFSRVSCISRLLFPICEDSGLPRVKWISHASPCNGVSFEPAIFIVSDEIHLENHCNLNQSSFSCGWWLFVWFGCNVCVNSCTPIAFFFARFGQTQRQTYHMNIFSVIFC